MKLANRSRNYAPDNKVRIRRLRSDMSVSEQVLWSLLKGRRIGFLFRRQHPVGPYALDFYCPEAMLCVEVDGEQHLTTLERDRCRDEFLLARRIRTIRIPSLDLFVRDGPVVERWLDRIQAECVERSGREAFPEPPPPAPSPSALRAQGEGLSETPSSCRRSREEEGAGGGGQ